MSREGTSWRGVRSLVLIALTTLAVGYGVLRVRERDWRAQATFPARAGFRSIGGVEVGSRIRIQGIDAGLVEGVQIPGVPGQPVVLHLRIDERLHHLVRADTVARINLQGVIGAKIVELVPGKPDAPPLAAEALLPSADPIELADLVVEASATLKRVDLAARSAEAGMREVASLASSVRDGQGTLGKLIRDDEVYQKLAALGDKGGKALDNLGENLEAVKRTWPISRYFDGKGFYDRERLLFQPGAERASRTLTADDLFRPGQAILTDRGRARLDEVATWCRRTIQPKSEVVIAAFTNDASAPDLAQVLTQEQADSVRNYLVRKHGIDSVGWFGSRKVAAVGFGSDAPHLVQADPSAPARRVEVILFTPKT